MRGVVPNNLPWISRASTRAHARHSSHLRTPKQRETHQQRRRLILSPWCHVPLRTTAINNRLGHGDTADERARTTCRGCSSPCSQEARTVDKRWCADCDACRGGLRSGGMREPVWFARRCEHRLNLNNNRGTRRQLAAHGRESIRGRTQVLAVHADAGRSELPRPDRRRWLPFACWNQSFIAGVQVRTGEVREIHALGRSWLRSAPHFSGVGEDAEGFAVHATARHFQFSRSANVGPAPVARHRRNRRSRWSDPCVSTRFRPTVAAIHARGRSVWIPGDQPLSRQWLTACDRG
jgi:hypothetical protein